MSLVPVYSNKSFLRLPRLDRIFTKQPTKNKTGSQEVEWIKDILLDYGLVLNGPVKPNARLGRSHVWVLETNGGKKILKRYNEEINPDQVMQEHSILNYLAQINFPAPRLASTKDNQQMVGRGGSQFALFDYLDGYFQYHNHIFIPGQTGTFLIAAGKALAALHEALKNFEPEGKNPNGFTSQEGPRWREPQWYFEKLETCRRDAKKLQTTQSHPVNDLLLQRADAIENRLAQLDQALKQANPQRLIIHGDYGPYNLFFKQGYPVVILDFELSRLDWRLTDLCNSLTTFSRNRMGFHPRKMKMFLDSYRTISPVSSNELSCLPVVWEFLSIRRAIVYWRHFLDKGTNRLLAAAQERLWTVDWINEHPGVFSDLDKAQ